MTLASYRAATAQRRKYGNKVTYLVGRAQFSEQASAERYANRTGETVERFDSVRESLRHRDLLLLLKAGAIRDLKRQVTFPLVVLGVKVGSVRPDWTYTEGDGVRIAEDSKGGIQTDVHKLRWKLAKVLHPDWDWRLS